MTTRGANAHAFVGWTIAGAGLCLGVLSGFSIGVVVLPVAMLFAGVLLVRQRTRNGSAVGLVSGAGLVPLYVAYLNRSGPGDACTHTRTEQHCTEMWSPWPWLAVGLFLTILGVVLFCTALYEDSRISDRCMVSP